MYNHTTPSPFSRLAPLLTILCITACQPVEHDPLPTDDQKECAHASSCQEPPDEEPDPRPSPTHEALSLRVTPSTSSPTSSASIDIQIKVLSGRLDTLSLSLAEEVIYTLQPATTHEQGDTLTIPVTLSAGENHIEMLANAGLEDTLVEHLIITYTPAPTAPSLTLDPSSFPSQTWEASLPFSAQISSTQKPDLEVDGEPIAITLAEDEGKEDIWGVGGSLPLKRGTHTYTFTALANALRSEPVTVTIERLVDELPPTITTRAPFNHQDILTRALTITGTIEDDHALATASFSHQGGTSSPITVQEDGSFAFDIAQLEPGPNTIAITAEDLVGNSSTHQLAIHYGARLAAGGAHSAVIFDDHLYCFGRNNKGQLGLGYTSRLGEANHPIAPQPIEHAETFVSLAISQNSSLALTSTGKVYAWGDNDEGQLGLGDASTIEFDDGDRLEPTAIASIQDAVSIARGYDHGMILRADGTVWTFGDNGSGQLGHDSDNSSDTPQQVSALTHIIQIVAGSKSSYALDDQGVVYRWGSNRYGNLGLGTRDDEAHARPTSIESLPPIAMLAAGRDHVLALSRAGEVFVWGLNANTQVGPEATLGDEVLAPVKRMDINEIHAVYAQANQSFILAADGNLYGWGQNLNGTLGIAAEEDIDTPGEPVFGLTSVRGVAIGALHGLARTEDQEIFAWGWSFEGSLGGGDDTIDRWAYRVPLLVDLPY